MARKANTLSQAEQLVRDILVKHFKQKVKVSDVREVAQKVADTVPASTKQAA